MTKFVLAITGPAGSGKSTVGEKLAKKLDKCVNIDADHIKHMIVSGFSYELQPNGTKKWDFNQWELVGDSIGLLARNFQNKGFDVVINGYINEPAWENIQKHVTFTNKFLLLPKLETAKSRDKQRPEDQPMGDEAVAEHHDYFSGAVFYHDFIKIDSTGDTVNQTIAKIMKLLEKQDEL